MKINFQKIIQIANLFILPLIFSVLFVYFPDNFQLWIGLMFIATLATVLKIIYIRNKFQYTIPTLLLSLSILICSLSLIFISVESYGTLILFKIVLIGLLIAVGSTHTLDEYRLTHFFRLLFTIFVGSFAMGMVKYYTNYLNKATEYVNSKFLKNYHSDNSNPDHQSHQYIIAALLFVVFAIPILWFVVGQLSNANSQFAELVNNFVNLINLGTFFSLFYFFVISAFLLGGMYRFLDVMTSSDLSEIENTKASLNHGIFMFFEAILVMLNIIYAIFSFVEINCNVHGLRQCVVDVKNYSSYSSAAYDGVISIALVVMFNLIIQYFTLEKRIVINKSFNKVNNYIAVVLTMLLAFASFERLYLYISGYGLSVIRTQVIFFYVFVIVACVLTIYSIYKKSNAFVNSIICTGFLMLAFISSLPFNQIIFNLNWQLAKNGMVEQYDIFYPYSKYEVASDANLKKEWIKRFESGDVDKIYKAKHIWEFEYNDLKQIIGK